MPTIKELSIIRNKVKEEKNKIENSEKSSKKNKGIILGIDLSKKKPGIAILSLELKKIVYTDDFEDKSKDTFSRYLEIKYWLENLIELFNPEAVMIEKEFIKSTRFGSKATIPLLKLHGYVYSIIKEYNLPMYEILPSSSRAFLKIKPNTKEGAFEYLQKKFPELQLTDFKKENDKADAVIIALNYLNNKKTEL